MKRSILITLIFLLPSIAMGDDDAPVTKAPCQIAADEIASIQKAQYKMKGKSGVPLAELQAKYDEKMAIYTAMKGIKDLKDSYLDFNNKVRDLTLGTEKDTLLQSLKSFLVPPYNETHEKFINWNKDLQEGATATASILAVENSLTEIYKRKYKPELTGEEFYTQVADGCKARPGESALCKEILGSTELLGIKSSIHSVMVGFYDTYSKLQKAKSEGKNGSETDQIKEQIIKDYRKLLLDELPSVDYMKDQLTMTKTYLEKTNTQYEAGRECLMKNLLSQKRSCANFAPELSKSVDEYAGQMKKLVTATDSKLGKDELKKFTDNAKTAAFENQIGDLGAVITALRIPIINAPEKVHKNLMAQHQLLRNRRNLMAGAAPITGGPKSVREIYEIATSFLKENVNSPACDNLLENHSASLNRKNLYACLYEFQKQKGEDSKEIEKRIDKAKEELDKMREDIVEILDNDFYKSHDKMKNILASNYAVNCAASDNKNCEEIGLTGLDEGVEVLKDNSGNIIAELNKDLMSKETNALRTQIDDFADLCQDPELEAHAKLTCKRGVLSRELKDVRNTYHFAYNPKTKKFAPEERQASWGEIFSENFEIPTQRLSSFMQRWNYNNNMMQFNQDYGKGLKTYNFQLEEYKDVWGDYAYPYYNNFNTTIWGTGGMYPSFYNPMSSTQFGYGNSSIYTSGSSNGFSFTQE